MIVWGLPLRGMEPAPLGGGVEDEKSEDRGQKSVISGQ